jgi:hypothetical protein
VKTLRSQKLRMLLTHRKLLQSKAIAIDNDLRGTRPILKSISGSQSLSRVYSGIGTSVSGNSILIVMYKGYGQRPDTRSA